MILHSDLGSIAISNWYRPPSAENEHIYSLRDELAELQSEVIRFIITGYLNIHHQKWLRFSSGNTAQGPILKDICDDFCFVQLVSEPIRDDYLLDLCLSDLDQ